ncbi:carbohydrate kinase family protein, partial [Bacillus sp. JJ1533]|uniref:carbohydrate kinase family protein n=1 Tax=Bacillus sp. JJ1533 TaxID=3122959 RepID=UPI0030003989
MILLQKQFEVIVAGHLCLDIIPNLQTNRPENLFQPGRLVNIGQALLSTGGAVSNTGIALHRLGIPTRLMGKVGDDNWGNIILDAFRQHDNSLVEGMIVSEGENSSYSIVISPENSDRFFMHYPGTNDTFNVNDIKKYQIEGAKLFHFGYPPLMKNMYEKDGEQLVQIFKNVKEQGLTTSLDMSKPDPNSTAGKVNWKNILSNVLPYVDIFLPSIEEALYMVNREMFEKIASKSGDISKHLNASLISELADELLSMGTPIVVLKLGDQGLYIKTTSNITRLKNLVHCNLHDIENWRGRELLIPCFEVNVSGTTGAGDCTIAG